MVSMEVNQLSAENSTFLKRKLTKSRISTINIYNPQDSKKTLLDMQAVTRREKKSIDMGSKMTQRTKFASGVSRTSVILVFKDLIEAKNTLRRERRDKHPQARKQNSEPSGSSKD